jgi:hypothetical protein
MERSRVEPQLQRVPVHLGRGGVAHLHEPQLGRADEVGEQLPAAVGPIGRAEVRGVVVGTLFVGVALSFNAAERWKQSPAALLPDGSLTPIRVTADWWPLDSELGHHLLAARAKSASTGSLGLARSAGAARTRAKRRDARLWRIPGPGSRASEDLRCCDRCDRGAYSSGGCAVRRCARAAAFAPFGEADRAPFVRPGPRRLVIDCWDASGLGRHRETAHASGCFEQSRDQTLERCALLSIAC